MRNTQNAIAVNRSSSRGQRNIESGTEAIPRAIEGSDTATESPRTSEQEVPARELLWQEQPPTLNDNAIIARQETIRIYRPKQRSLKSVAMDDARKKIGGRNIVLYTESPRNIRVVPKKAFPCKLISTHPTALKLRLGQGKEKAFFCVFLRGLRANYGRPSAI